MAVNLSSSSITAIVPAAGIGSRMQQSIPKQYLTLFGKTILEHTLFKLLNCHTISEIIIALHPQDNWYPQLQGLIHPRIKTVVGGKSRAESVLAGLSWLHDDEWALVHDAVRPCLQLSDIDKLVQKVFDTPGSHGGILAVPVSDTIKQSTEQQTICHTIDRAMLWQALTPQLFPVRLLKQSLQKALSNKQMITDEASAMEYCGYHPSLVYGRRDNIKVTLPEDLALAEFFLNKNKEQ